MQEFPKDYNNFKKSIADLDRRLASIVCQAFDDCSGLEAVFKLVDIFGSLLERPLIKEDFDPNYPLMVSMMDDELNQAKQIYDKHMSIKEETGKMPIHKNMAKVSGSLKFAQELRERISTPMNRFKMTEHPYVSLSLTIMTRLCSHTGAKANVNAIATLLTLLSISMLRSHWTGWVDFHVRFR